MRALGVALLLASSGCFLDPDRSIDVTDSTQALCSPMPATCNNDPSALLGRWTMNQDCSLDATNLACGRYEWRVDSVAPLTMTFKADGIVSIQSIGRTTANLVFAKACSSSTTACQWTNKWECIERSDGDCECNFNERDSGTLDNAYITSQGVVSFSNGQVYYNDATYCIDGDQLYLIFLSDGAYERFHRD